MSSILINNAFIVTMNQDRQVLQGGLLVEDDRISSIGDINQDADRVIDARGQVLIPGLIQAHVHLCQTLFRGQADDMQLMDWLQTRIWPLEGAHDPESVYYSALLGIGELFRGGTTAIIDMESVHYAEHAFQAIVDTGIRAISGKIMMDCGPPSIGNLLENTSNSLQQSVDLLERWHGAAEGRLQYAFTPRFAISCSEELLVQVRDLADRYNVAVHTHASENRNEIAIVQAEKGTRNIVYLDQLGLTDTNLILAHCIWVDEEEIEILRRSGTKVVHCPSCNLKLGSGIAPIPQMLAQGIHVALGADGAPCNNNLDQFIEMRTASLIQKPLHGPTAMPDWQTFELATLGGAAAMGLEQQIGSLEVGKKADLALVNLNNLHCAPVDYNNIYSQLVYQAKSSDVTLTMVDGQIVFANDRLTTIDESDLLVRCNEAIKRVRRRAGL
ncbi:Melamine deaminase [Sporotomaculum syntrophicum]|uniref:5-methylthioadenosine/S-adenosylhomocysteine deaminase n=1 Tax=Sporotomaculum syntrophicum TaxID=182264 RepID=A0A9D2WQP0_9FIRM|nr:5'-deoxyadenosine deaminase [Sporotomaculum syntrophicum]KAF1085355.1 Melamine deaminase [Sporotomaculum syntrophicum]